MTECGTKFYFDPKQHNGYWTWPSAPGNYNTRKYNRQLDKYIGVTGHTGVYAVWSVREENS